MVLIVDDLHWADTGTTQLLAHLLRTRAVPGCCVIATARTADLGELLGRMRRQPSFEQIELTGLTADETRALVGAPTSARSSSAGSPTRPRATRSSSRRRCAALPELEERALSRIAVPDGVKEMLSAASRALARRPTRC